MYLIAKFTGVEAQQVAQAAEPFGPRFPASVVRYMTHLEIWGSSFQDEGPDWTEFRAYAHDKLLKKRRIPGF